MSKLHLLALLGTAAVVAGQCSQVGGMMSDGCCVCKEGYTGDNCDQCEPGYVKEAGGQGRCGAGRDMTACIDDAPFPYHGCKSGSRQLGQCSKRGGKSVFPCVCMGGDCDARFVQRNTGQGGCWPAGPRMFTTFPNEPLQGEEFDLTVVGCNLNAMDKYLVVPKDDDKPCSAQPAQWTGAAECTGNNDGTFTISGDCLTNGASITNLVQGDAADQPVQGMSEATFRKLTIAGEGRFRLCQATIDPAGNAVWAEVPSHNASERDREFSVCSDSACGAGTRDINAAGAATGDEECDCHKDGMLVFDICIPTWLVILGFIFLSCSLCALALLIRKQEQKRAEADKFVDE